MILRIDRIHQLLPAMHYDGGHVLALRMYLAPLLISPSLECLIYHRHW